MSSLSGRLWNISCPFPSKACNTKGLERKISKSTSSNIFILFRTFIYYNYLGWRHSVTRFLPSNFFSTHLGLWATGCNIFNFDDTGSHLPHPGSPSPSRGPSPAWRGRGYKIEEETFPTEMHGVFTVLPEYCCPLYSEHGEAKAQANQANLGTKY